MRLAFAALALLALGSDAEAQTKAQNAVKHVAQVHALSEYCKSAKVNETMLAFALMGNGVAAKDVLPGGKLNAHYRRMYEEAVAVVKPLTEDAVCLMALVAYGPTGGNVAGLVTLTGK